MELEKLRAALTEIQQEPEPVHPNAPHWAIRMLRLLPPPDMPPPQQPAETPAMGVPITGEARTYRPVVVPVERPDVGGIRRAAMAEYYASTPNFTGHEAKIIAPMLHSLVQRETAEQETDAGQKAGAALRTFTQAIEFIQSTQRCETPDALTSVLRELSTSGGPPLGIA